MKRLLIVALAAGIAAGVGTAAWALSPEHDMTYSGTTAEGNAIDHTGLGDVKQGACSFCHVPHGAQGARLSASPAPGGLPPELGEIGALFCAQCHYSTTGGSYIAVGAPNADAWITGADLRKNHPVQNATLSTPDTDPAASGWPYGVVGGMQCTSCHDPHKNTEEGGEAQFLRARSYSATASPQSFCTNCHGSRESTAVNQHPVNIIPSANIQSQLDPGTGNVTAVGAFNVDEGDSSGGHLVADDTDGVDKDPTVGRVSCMTCHEVHDSDTPEYLLPYDDPATASDTAGTYDGDICALCHTAAPQGILAQNHPVLDDSATVDGGLGTAGPNSTEDLGVVLYDPTSGHSKQTTVKWPNKSNLPLVVIGGKKYMNCYTCHGDTHDSDSNNAVQLLREDYKDLCNNCHGENPGWYMANGNDVGSHMVGDGTDDGIAWLADLEANNYATGGKAAVVADWTSDLPVYLANSSDAHQISCKTCHEAHNAAGIGALHDGRGYDADPNDRVLLIADNDNFNDTGSGAANTGASYICVNCHKPTGTHPTSEDETTNDIWTSGTSYRTVDLTKYPANGAEVTYWAADGTANNSGPHFPCQGCHSVHAGDPKFGTFIIRASPDAGTITGDGTGAQSGATEPTSWNRDNLCGECHTQ
ncbi:MAG: hypothetical protein Kow0092_37490 [Deferrisomatales bacterium]